VASPARCQRPRVILIDEPTARSTRSARIVMDLLRRIAADQSAAAIIVCMMK
jgi:putative ABC transport system ATP-binding protein